MLQSLHVKNLALIDEIEVEFAEGLNILTGETGAGKSIILGSVNLALGGRYTKDLIRQGENYALVELVFTVTEKSRLKALEKLCIYPEDGLLILSRKLMDGRSVSRINGETVTNAPFNTAEEPSVSVISDAICPEVADSIVEIVIPRSIKSFVSLL